MSALPHARVVPFLNIGEFLGLAKRSSPARDDRQKIQRWASLLLEHSVKRFGAHQPHLIDERLQTLAERHPNFAEVIDWISAELAFAHAAGEGLSFVRAMLVGAAGTGKTTFSLELAKVLSLPAEVICMNNLQTAAALAGTERHWANSEPGAVFRLLARSPVINPVMVLDEIDKVQGYSGRDPLNALYTLLERRTAQRFADTALPDVHFNASRVNWIATANSMDMLGTPLTSRFTVFSVRKLNRDEMAAMISRMYRELLDAHPAVRARMDVELPDHATHVLLGLLENGRDVDRLLRMLIGHALKTGQSTITAQHLPAIPSRRHSTVGFV
ncbi:AAA family ATPase [Paraburkholderia sp.]|uniref:AAA family ATPase n=1 Tax=Paraburkholderia sp. TaxID=1926495 RepID=UPI0025E932C2|nr:AAA family ATPase [Paraburkholderia sp.]